MKRTVLLVSLLFLSHLTLAAGFGAYSPSTEKTTEELSTSFKVGLVNPGNETLDVSFSTPGNGNFSTDFPLVELPPSEVSSSPGGDGWYYLGNGEYIKPEMVSFDVNISRERTTNTLEFPVTVLATPSTGEEGDSALQIFHERTLQFRLNVDRSIEMDRPEPDEWREVGEPEVVNLTDPESSEDGSDESVAPRESNVTSNKTQREKQDSGEREVNSVTYILVAGILVSLVYIAKVI